MADEIRQQLGLDASDAINELKRLDAALAQVEQRSRSTAAAFGSFNKTGASITSLSRQGVSAYNQLGQAGVKNAKSIGSAFDQLISVNGKFSTSLGLLSRIVFTQSVVSGFRMVRTSIEESVGASIEFQKQLAQIRSIDTDKIFGADLGDKLRGISTDFNIALPDVATGAYEALSAQVLKSADDLQFLEAAAAFSKGSLTNMEASVSGLAGALNAYGQDVSNVDRIASQFNKTIELGTIRGEELSHGFGTIATLGKQLGVSQAELLASIAALTNAGVPQAQAFTQVRGALLGLVKPTDAMTKLFRQNGIASAESLIAARGWGGALQFLRSQTDGTTAATAELFQNQRALLGVLSLGGQNRAFFDKAFAGIDGVASSLNKDRALEVMASDGEKLTASFNQLTNSLIPVGNALVFGANKAIEAGGAMANLAVAISDAAVSTAKLTPRFTEFGNTWDRVRALFGADLTIGEHGGKIVSEVEIIQRRLEAIDRRREEENKLAVQRESLRAEALNKIRFKEIDDVQEANQELQTEVRSAADRLLAIERNKVAELSKSIQQSRQLTQNAPSRIADLQTRRDELQLRSRISGLSDPQQALALMQRSQALASQAEQQMRQAALTGNTQLADRARNLFSAASATAQEAQSTAAAAGARDREAQAARTLLGISQSQISAEESLARATAQQLPTLEQRRAKMQASLDITTKAVQELVKNSSLFGRDGQPVDPAEAAKRAEARARALQILTEQGIPKQQVIQLQFQTDGALQQLQAKLTSIDSMPFERIQVAIQSSVAPSQQIAAATERSADAAERAAAALRSQQRPSPALHALGGRTGYFANGGRGTDTIPAMLSPGEFVVNARSTGRFFSQLQAINAGQSPTFRSDGGSVTNVGDVNVTIKTSDPSQINGRQIGRELRREIRRGNIKL